MDFSEKWGRDIEEAVKLALNDLKLERDQVEVIVLEEPTKGFLGFGSKLAKVRVQKIADKKVAIEEKKENVSNITEKTEYKTELQKKENKAQAGNKNKTEQKKSGKERKNSLQKRRKA